MGLWSALIACALTAPRRTIALMATLVLLVVPGLFRLRLMTDGRALVPADHHAVVDDREVARHFDRRDPVIIFLESRRPEGIFHGDFLRRLVELTAAVQELTEVSDRHVVSLATEPSDRFLPGTVTLRRLLDPVPDTPELLARLRQDMDTIGILDGTLVASDRRAATVLVGITQDVDRADLIATITRTAERFADAQTAVHVVGAPVAEALLGAHILADLLFLVPLSVALIAGAVFWFCRRVAAVAIVMVKIGACLVFVVGLMGVTGSPVYLTTAILPVVLVALGLADEMHLLAHYQIVLPAGGDAPPRTMADMRRAIVLTSVTTAFGFGSFLASDLAPVRSFGVFAPAGILFCLLWSLTATPALLRLLPARAMALPPTVFAARDSRMVQAAERVLRRARPLRAALAAISIVAALACTQLTVQDSWIEGFAPRSAFRTSTALVNSRLFGTHTLLLAVTADLAPDEPLPAGLLHAGPLLNPKRLDAIGRLEACARAQPGVGGTLGLHSQLQALSILSRGRAGHVIEPRAGEIERLVRLFTTARGEDRRREMVDDAMRRTLVMCLLKNANYQDTARIMTALRAFADAELRPLGMTLAFAGDVAVSQAMIPAIVQTQVSSLFWTLVLNFSILWAAFRSLRAAAWCSLPSALGVVWVFGVMGCAGIPLGVATSMFCAISLGVGVDYAIHLHERTAAAQALGPQPGLPAPAAIGLAESAPAIIADTLAIATGFGSLMVSRVPANARLALLVALALGSACVLTLFGLGGMRAAERRK